MAVPSPSMPPPPNSFRRSSAVMPVSPTIKVFQGIDSRCVLVDGKEVQTSLQLGVLKILARNGGKLDEEPQWAFDYLDALDYLESDYFRNGGK